MLKLHCHYLFPVLLFISINMQAQFVNYGSDPARFKWNSVRTQHYKLIYPQGIDSAARRYAALLETVYPYLGGTGRLRGGAFPVVLHPGSMLSNGMVAWAPRRMELITTPPAHLYAQSWDKQLVIHESRHVFQTDRLTRRLFSPLYYVVGEQAAGVSGFAVPKWFFEGDAVTAETALSGNGRGRQPEFNMIYRAQTIGSKPYTFDKWFLGSYKDYTGNFYALGYNLTAYARYRYGADIWDKVVNRYTRHIYLLPPFSHALNHYTGIGTAGLFRQTFAFLKDEWEKQDSLYTAGRDGGNDPVYILPEAKQYTSYQHPQIVNDSTVIAVKSSLRDITALIAIKNGKKERLTYTGHINSRIALKNNRIYWTEYVPDIRWTHENYSVIKYYDLDTKRTVTLTPRGRYLSPAPDAGGRTIAVSHVTETGINQIVWIDAESGKEKARYDIPGNAFVKEITFGADGSMIAVTLGDDGIRIRQLDGQTNLWKELLHTAYVTVTAPVWHDGKLYFESGLNGTNNIYCLDTKTLQCLQLTAARFGAFSPALPADGKRLFYADYQAKGYRIASILPDSLTTDVADFTRPHRFTLAEAVSRQEPFNLDTAGLSSLTFNPKPYHRLSHLFKVHSWAPFFYDASSLLDLQTDDLTTAVKPGAMILSQNTLNTAMTQLGWYYTEGRHHGKLAFTYMGWYPVIDLNVDYGGRAIDALWVQYQDGDEKLKEGISARYTGRNLIEAQVRAYIPFNLTRNHYISRFQPSVTYYYTNDAYQQYKSGKLRNFQYLLAELLYYRYRKLSGQDILPRWGGQIRLQHLRTPFNTENYGNLYATQFTGYLPGLVQNNGLMLRLGYQYQNVDDKALYVPRHLLNAPRGYSFNYSTWQQWAFKADYSFNIIYPDLSISWLAYIRRIRGNLFYDHSLNSSNKGSHWTTQSSYGGDLLFDWNVIRAEFPLSTGVRIIKPVQHPGIQTELLFNISF